MAQRRPTMMDPQIESLLDKVDSKFTLVTLAAKRGRQINSYFNQLGEGLGAIVPLTFSALASEPARTSLWDSPEPIPHTRLGQSADLIVVAPTTARVLGKYVAGISDDLLTATLLATRAPVLVCPAMHTEMWEHTAVQENLATLRRRGVHVLDPEEGRLARGDIGAGR